MTDGASAWAYRQELESKIVEQNKQEEEIRQIARKILSIKPGTEEHKKLLYLYNKADIIYKQQSLIDLLR